jgi:hypothetical protein
MLSRVLSRGGLALAAVICSIWVLAGNDSFAQTPVRTAVLTSSAADNAIQTAQYTPANQQIVQPVHWGRGWGWGRSNYYRGPYYSYYAAPAPYVTYYPPAPYVTNYYQAPYAYYYYPRRFVYRGGYYW